MVFLREMNAAIKVIIGTYIAPPGVNGAFLHSAKVKHLTIGLSIKV